ncbi:MAG TPA: serine--tRNA ligase [Limnochordia bacterium]|nr:serine--tRNA ligase [Limnochordia bacterium]
MLDLKRIRTEPEALRAALARRGPQSAAAVDRLLSLDQQWRQQLSEVESLKAERNRVSEEIGRKKRAGEAAEEQVAAMKAVGERIKTIDAAVAELSAQIDAILLELPNPPHPSVPDGADADANVEVRRWGTPKDFAFEPKAHWDLGPALGQIDFERAAKLSGARFAVLKGDIARLERALVALMLDLHAKDGYVEVAPPYLVNRDSMVGTGQLPKFAEDMFAVEPGGFYLIPTAEVPVTNLHRDEILAAEQLPLRYAAYSPCFRAEAGAHGRDTRGLIRTHQFDKVELVVICKPDESYAWLEAITLQAEKVLQALELPYRVMEMCTGDLGEKGAKQYDPEVWLPSYGRYVEISSASNFEDWQARRAQIRYRPEPGAKPEFCHTLNASGLALSRTLAAVLENHQNADGSITLPDAVRPYLGGQAVIG